jgi:hypothetical protein
MTASNVQRTVTVAAASRQGSTEEIVDRVADRMREALPTPGASAAAIRAMPGRSSLPTPWCWAASSKASRSSPCSELGRGRGVPDA